ncbi:leucine-rich repeat protein [uncultured Eubacterium sp.]|uniref:leucine-rich repeat protein n=1 Tax=uncultured Eubacterium sp. TaxID=165185 RepID=UPI000EC58BBD|nr:leucine-rich repeat protein [uncultured Eubacterium sp.]HAH19028.1 hypothetical protein [Eubacterium sp.]
MKIKKILATTLAMAVTVSLFNGNYVKEVKADSLSDRLYFDRDFESELGLDNSAYIDYLRKFDKDDSGYLDLDEQASIKEISIVDETDGHGNITMSAGTVCELKNIEKFVNLEKLHISHCNVPNMDLAKCNNLKEVYIQKYIGSFSINASNMANLETFVLGDIMGKEYTQITSVDFSNDSKLKSVMLMKNTDLEKVDFTGCSALDAAYIMFESKMTSLDVSDCIKLRYLDIRRNITINKIYAPSTFNEKNLAHKWEEGKAGNNVALVSGFYYDLPCTVYFGKPGNEATSKKFTGDPAKINTNNGSSNSSNTTQVKVFAYKNNYYRVISGKAVEFTSTVNKKVKSIVIPATVKYNGKTYKVTKVSDNSGTFYDNVKKITFGKNIATIGKNSFHCPKLTKIIFKGKAVKKIKKKAILDVKKKVKVKALKKVRKKYIKLLKKSGLKKVK